MQKSSLEERYQQQLDEKQQRLEEMLSPFACPEIEVFASPPENYRMRAEFRIWHDGDDIYYAMFEPGDKRAPIRIDNSPMVSAPINALMPKLLEALKQSTILRHKLFQVDFLSTLTGEVLVSLLYHKAIGEEWKAEALELKAQLGINIIGRSRKVKLILDRDYVVESLKVDGKTLHYQQVENSFTQPNANVAIKMLEWSRSVARQAGGDLLELYCGNGNFSIALSDCFNKVLATELAKSSVYSAQENIRLNEIKNLDIVRLSSEDFTQAINKVRSFRRLEGIDLEAYDFSTVLVDPPRAGLDEGTLKMIQQFKHILYISCNPQTLKENLELLSETHVISRAALFDQFPFTDHMESGVWLVKK